jgi:hypothetical protein
MIIGVSSRERVNTREEAAKREEKRRAERAPGNFHSVYEIN